MNVRFPNEINETEVLSFLFHLCRDHGCFWRPGRAAASFVDRVTNEPVLSTESARQIDEVLSAADELLGGGLVALCETVAQEFNVVLSENWLAPGGTVEDGHLPNMSLRVVLPASTERADLLGFWLALIDVGVALHPDDPADTIVRNVDGAPFFTAAECNVIERVVQSAFNTHGDRVYDIALHAMQERGYAPTPPC
jgi:hypothetical protein